MEAQLGRVPIAAFHTEFREYNMEETNSSGIDWKLFGGIWGDVFIL